MLPPFCSPVALIQLASHNTCFLLDVEALLERVTETELSKFTGRFDRCYRCHTRTLCVTLCYVRLRKLGGRALVISTLISDVVFREGAVVVGYALAQDFKKLLQTIPVMGAKLGTHTSVVDLAIPHKHLTRAVRLKRSEEIRGAISAGLPLPEARGISQHTGLSRLCEMVFSVPMDKTCQVGKLLTSLTF